TKRELSASNHLPGPGSPEVWILEFLPRARDLLRADRRTLGRLGDRPASAGTESDDETIKDTALAQPLLVASAIACAGELGVRPGAVAGHSVGEIAAAQIAGILTAADAMRFVSVRGQGMASAAATTPTGMSAVVGGQPEDVLSAIETAGASPANVNGGGQTVAAGSLDALSALSENPPERTRVIPLQVAGAFHTEYMAPATDG